MIAVDKKPPNFLVGNGGRNPKVDCKNILKEKISWWKFQEEKPKLGRIGNKIIGGCFCWGSI